MKNNYTNKVEMMCPSCKGKMFEYNAEEKNSKITCKSCNKQFTKEELLKNNHRNIENNFKKLGEEAMKDFANDFKKMFSQNKNIKIKF